MISPVQKWRLALIVITVIAIACIGFLSYIALDASVTISDMTRGRSDTEKSLKRLAQIFPKDSYSKKDVLYLLKKDNPGAFIVESQCAVQIDGLRFEFDTSGKLININTKALTTDAYICTSNKQKIH
jgi:hypothetical protein